MTTNSANIRFQFWVATVLSACSLLISIYTVYDNRVADYRQGKYVCIGELASWSREFIDAYRDLMISFSLWANDPEDSSYLSKSSYSWLKFNSFFHEKLGDAKKHECKKSLQDQLVAIRNEASNVREALSEKKDGRIDVLQHQASIISTIDWIQGCCEK